MSNQDINTIKNAVSSQVNNGFEHIKARLHKAIKYQANNQPSIDLLNTTSLVFSNDVKMNYLACAVFDDIEFEQREPTHIIEWQLGRANSYARTLIHELSHIIISNTPRILINNGSGPHCLEFAIVTYSIEHKIWQNNDRDKCYFDSYDVHEDKCYPILSINPCKFDSIIKCMEWTTFDDLVTQAENLAKKIRKKLVV